MQCIKNLFMIEIRKASLSSSHVSAYCWEKCNFNTPSIGTLPTFKKLCAHSSFFGWKYIISKCFLTGIVVFDSALKVFSNACPCYVEMCLQARQRWMVSILCSKRDIHCYLILHYPPVANSRHHSRNKFLLRFLCLWLKQTRLLDFRLFPGANSWD